MSNASRDQSESAELSFAAERLEIKLRVHSHGRFTNQRGKMSASAEEKLME